MRWILKNEANFAAGMYIGIGWSCACGVCKKMPRSNEETFASLASVLPKRRKPRSGRCGRPEALGYTPYRQQGLVMRSLGYVRQSNLYLPCLLSNISVTVHTSSSTHQRQVPSNKKAITNNITNLRIILHTVVVIRVHAWMSSWDRPENTWHLFISSPVTED